MQLWITLIFYLMSSKFESTNPPHESQNESWKHQQDLKYQAEWEKRREEDQKTYRRNLKRGLVCGGVIILSLIFGQRVVENDMPRAFKVFVPIGVVFALTIADIIISIIEKNRF